MSNYELTQKQVEVLREVSEFQNDYERKPTHGELSRLIGRNKSSISSSLRSLERNNVIMMNVNHYAFLACVCGLKMKVPPDFKQKEVKCPRCGKTS